VKKILILEGIATSGKTTLKEKLTHYFNSQGINTLVIGEEETLMPILENTDKKVSVKLLSEVLSKALKSESEVIIFDRLYFTHIFRTKSDIGDFASIENLLLENKTMLVLLTVEKPAVKDRIFLAMKQRGKNWTKYVGKKGTEAEIVEYYTDQQDKLIDLTKKSKLPSIILDATTKNYNKLSSTIAQQISQKISPLRSK